MQLLFVKWVLNMEGNIASDIFMHVPGWHCFMCVILYRIGVLLAWEKHNHVSVIPDHVISIVPGEHPPCYHGGGDGELSDQVNLILVQDYVILLIVVDEGMTMHSILWLLSSDNLRLRSLMEMVSNMLNGAGQNTHIAEFTAGCLHHLPPQLQNGQWTRAACGLCRRCGVQWMADCGSESYHREGQLRQ